MKLTIAVLLFGFTQFLPQERINKRHETTDMGYVIVDKDSVFGRIKINLEYEHVMVSKDKNNRLVTARHLDRAVVNGRIYIGQKLGTAFYLFEEVVKLDASLVYRENLKYHSLDEIMVGPWFIVDGEKVQPVLKSNQLMDIFKSDKKWMSQYMKSSGLDPMNRADMMSAFKYYQSTTF